MDSDIIVIEDDSPPNSPISATSNYLRRKQIETLDLTEENLPTCDEKTSLWTQRTSNYIKNTMNFSIIEKNNNKTEVSCEVINLTTTDRTTTVTDNRMRHVLQKRDIFTDKSTQISHTNDPRYSAQQYYPNDYMYTHSEIGTICYPIYDGSTCLTPVAFPQPVVRDSSGYYIKNYMPSVKYDENLHYVPQNFTHGYCNEDYNTQLMPEFIDINNLMNYNNTVKNIINGTSSLDTRLDANKNLQTTDSDPKSTSLKNNKRHNKNSVPLFLKRNRSINSLNKMKVIDLSNDNINNQTEEETDPTISKSAKATIPNDDDLDVVYVGAYARQPKYPGSQPTVYKLPAVEDEDKDKSETENSGSPISVSNESRDSQNTQDENNDSTPKGKRKRKPVLTVPRRNPKRQVQIEKDYLKLLDNVICESKKESKTRKPKRTSKGNLTEERKRANCDGSSRTSKRPARQSVSCGAVYRPPSPLTRSHIRPWPISDDKSSEDNKELWLLCHEMFHHVFAYGATVKSFKKQEKALDKMEFMKDLSLMEPLAPLNLSTQRPQAPSDSPQDADERDLLALKDLMQNSLLLYCLTNDIDRDNVAKYIDSLVPEEIIQWSNKQFNLFD